MNNDIYTQELIICNKERRGTGKLGSPIRIIQQIYTKEGELLAEKDPSPETFVLFDLIHFFEYCKRNDIISPTPQTVELWLQSLEKKSNK